MGSIHIPLASRVTRKSRFVWFPGNTRPSSPSTALPSPFESSQKRNPLVARSTSNAESSWLRTSGRGVSPQIGDQRLSHPSMLSADTPMQREMPLGSTAITNSGAMVVPSSPHVSSHTYPARSRTARALYTRYCLKPFGSLAKGLSSHDR
jgi:hypothetical protein